LYPIVPPVSKLSGHPACAISAYQHLSCELQPLSWRGVLDTTFQLYRGCKFYCWRKLEYLEKTTDLSEITDELYDIMLYRVHLAMKGVATHNLGVDRQEKTAIVPHCTPSFKTQWTPCLCNQCLSTPKL
jgi:hypothetical protein